MSGSVTDFEQVPNAASARTREALLDDVPTPVLIRSLAALTRAGVIAPRSPVTAYVVERLRGARLHPLALLLARAAYAFGHGSRGRGRWDPEPTVVAALDEAFHAAFANVEPVGARMLLALDVSESMGVGSVAGGLGLSPAVAAAAIALIAAATESNPEIVGFFAGPDGVDFGPSTRRPGWPSAVSPVSIGPRDRLEDVATSTAGLPFGATDCALAVRYALARRREVDVFVVCTDVSASIGDSPSRAAGESVLEALGDYRGRTGIQARLVVLSLVAGECALLGANDGAAIEVVTADTIAALWPPP